MRKVIEGKVYDTDTATHVCSLPCHTPYKSDFNWHETDLYRSSKGQYFISGEGGPRSMWSEPSGNNSWSSGRGLRLVEPDEARQMAEDAELGPHEMEAAGFDVEEG